MPRTSRAATPKSRKNEVTQLVKLRQVPEHFIVDEVGGPEPITEDWRDAPQRLYHLEKRGHDTLALLAKLSSQFRISRGDWGTAGLKDRHAVTTQMVSLPSKYELCKEIGESREGERWKLTLLGGTQNKLRAGDHDGNRFTLVIGDIDHRGMQSLPGKVAQLEAHGVPNWFDAQRFGSAVNGELPGASILRRDFKRAMHLFLVKRHNSDRSVARQDKKRIQAAWPHLDRLQDEEIKHKPFRKPLRAFTSARDDEDPFKAAYLALPRDLRGMWLSAWQSRVWNATLAGTIYDAFEDHLLHEVPIHCGGPLLYPHAPTGKRGAAKHTLIQDIANRMQKLPDTIPTAAPGIEVPHILDLIESSGIHPEDLDLSDCDGFVAAHERPTLIRPGDLELSQPRRDPRNGSQKHKRWEFTVSFTLPTGAYATNVIKRLFH